MIKNATVFGGTGFVGRHLIQRLAKTGATITVVTRSIERVKHLKPLGQVGQIVPMLVDLKDEAALDHAITHSDAVVNLLGTISANQRTMQFLHEELPRTIAKISLRAEVNHFVHVSAKFENPHSSSYYVSTKGKGEIAVSQEFEKSIILCPSLIFGREDIFFNQIASLISIMPILPIIAPNSRFQPVFVGDVADAIMLALQRSPSSPEVYELAGPRSYTMMEIYKLVSSVIDRHPRLVVMPKPIALLAGSVLGHLPGKVVTYDQVKMLFDACLPDKKNYKQLADLGITQPQALETVLPTYLNRFRRGGRFAAK